jgi:hypothetical protein
MPWGYLELPGGFVEQKFQKFSEADDNASLSHNRRPADILTG